MLSIQNKKVVLHKYLSLFVFLLLGLLLVWKTFHHDVTQQTHTCQKHPQQFYKTQISSKYQHIQKNSTYNCHIVIHQCLRRFASKNGPNSQIVRCVCQNSNKKNKYNHNPNGIEGFMLGGSLVLVISDKRENQTAESQLKNIGIFKHN